MSQRREVSIMLNITLRIMLLHLATSDWISHKHHSK